VAVADDAGYFRLVDWRKDIIITAGYNVYPAEIERGLAGHPAGGCGGGGADRRRGEGELARA
jgi:long-chain acyl-CoA synthetase